MKLIISAQFYAAVLNEIIKPVYLCCRYFESIWKKIVDVSIPG